MSRRDRRQLNFPLEGGGKLHWRSQTAMMSGGKPISATVRTTSRTSWGWIVYFALSKQKKLDDREVGRADTLAEAQALAQRDYGQQTR
jgi:hypothetical protein